MGLGLLRGQLFRELLDQISLVRQLEDCPIPVTVSVYDVYARKTRTFSQGRLSDIIYASSAMPPLFQPLRINQRLFWDGGIKDRPGLAGVALGERVLYHHIASRSPWRRTNSPALRMPERDNMVSLVIQNLPRVSPNQLARGPVAFNQARLATQQALDQPVGTPIIYAS